MSNLTKSKYKKIREYPEWTVEKCICKPGYIEEDCSYYGKPYKSEYIKNIKNYGDSDIDLNEY